jgi:hypothetical protein
VTVRIRREAPLVDSWVEFGCWEDNNGDFTLAEPMCEHSLTDDDLLWAEMQAVGQLSYLLHTR